MIPADFAYERAETVDHALELLATHGFDARIIAGGQSLLPLMKLRLARPERVIDIGRLHDLAGVRLLPDGRLAIGALTTYAALLGDPRVSSLALLADALPSIGDVQVRNRGTIGGAIAHADPAADLAAVFLALGVEIVCRSADRGERILPIETFFQGPFATDLAPDELLTEIHLPAAAGSLAFYASAYRALRQQASGFAIAGVAVVLGRSTDAGSGPVDDVRVAVTGVADAPYRAAGVETALRGRELDSAAIDAAVGAIADDVQVQADIHAHRDYRAAMAGVMARRALAAAWDRLA